MELERRGEASLSNEGPNGEVMDASDGRGFFFVELRSLNAPDAVKSSRAKVETDKKKLVSDVKKTTAFVKKVRAASDETIPNLLRDVVKLNLRRYVSEIVSAILDAPMKPKDSKGVVKLVCLMHQRYEDFSAPFLTQLSQSFDSIETSLEKKDIIRRHAYAIVAVSLYIGGVAESPAVFLKMLRKMMRTALNTEENLSDIALSNLPGIIGVLNISGFELTGILPSSLGKDSPESVLTALGIEDQLAESPVSADLQNRCSTLLYGFRDALWKKLKHDKIKLDLQRRQNRKEILNRATLNERKAQNLKSMEEGYQAAVEGAIKFAELMNCKMVELDDKENTEFEESEGRIQLWDTDERDMDSSISPEAWMFGDEESRSFYQDLPDLSGVLSSSALTSGGRSFGDVVKEIPGRQEKTASGETSGVERERLENLCTGNEIDEDQNTLEPDCPGKCLRTDTASATFQNTDKVSETGDNSSDSEDSIDLKDDPLKDCDVIRHTISSHELTSRIRSCQTRAAADKLSVDFCHVANKKTLKRLVEALRRAPGTRCELLPYCARIAATVSRVCPIVGKRIMEHLEREFRWFQKHGEPKNLDRRLLNIRFICELVKFGYSVPDLGATPEKAFYLLNTFLNNFSGDVIHCVCAFLECVGRFLYRCKDTHAEAAQFLCTLVKFSREKLPSDKIQALDNAIFFIIPPRRREIEDKKSKKPPEELFIRYLFFEFLGGKYPPTYYTTLDRRRRRRAHRLLGSDAGHGNSVDGTITIRENIETSVVMSGQEAAEGPNEFKVLESDESEAETASADNTSIDIHLHQKTFVLYWLSRLNWDTKNGFLRETVRMVVDAALAACKKRQSSINLLSSVLSVVSFKHPCVGIVLVDRILENFEYILETNESSFYQKSLGVGRMFGGLFASRVVNANVFFDSLYMIINYGHSVNWPQHQVSGEVGTHASAEQTRIWALERQRRPRGPNFGGCSEVDASSFHPSVYYDSDPIDEGFRARLVCSIIDSCGLSLSSPELRRRLKRFWLHFERYLHWKSLDDFALRDVVDSTYARIRKCLPRRPACRGDSERAVSDFEPTFESFLKRRKQAIIKLTEEISKEDDHEAGKMFRDDQLSRGCRKEDADERDEEERATDSDDSEESNDNEDSQLSDDSEFEDLYSELKQVNLRSAEDEDFELEFAKLMQETTAPKSASKSTSMDRMTVPHHLLLKVKDTGSGVSNLDLTRSGEVVGTPRVLSFSKTISEQVPKPAEVSPGVPFKLVKRGLKGRLEFSKLNLPQNSSIVKSVVKGKAQEQEELSLLKRHLVQFESRSTGTDVLLDQEDHKDLNWGGGSSGIRNGKSSGQSSSIQNRGPDVSTAYKLAFG